MAIHLRLKQKRSNPRHPGDPGSFCHQESHSGSDTAGTTYQSPRFPICLANRSCSSGNRFLFGLSSTPCATFQLGRASLQCKPLPSSLRGGCSYWDGLVKGQVIGHCGPSDIVIRRGSLPPWPDGSHSRFRPHLFPRCLGCYAALRPTKAVLSPVLRLAPQPTTGDEEQARR